MAYDRRISYWSSDVCSSDLPSHPWQWFRGAFLVLGMYPQTPFVGVPRPSPTHLWYSGAFAESTQKLISFCPSPRWFIHLLGCNCATCAAELGRASCWERW